MASKALEKTFIFVDTIEKANQVKYLAGDFMRPFVVGANNGYDNVRAASLRKQKSPSKYDLFYECLEQGLVTENQWKMCH